MSSFRYPLDALVRLRQDEVEEAARTLSAAAREHEGRVRERTRTEQRRDDLERAVEEVRRVELEALERGDLSAVDLARADAWSLRVSAQRRALEADVDRALAAERRAEVDEDAARSRLRSRRVDARQVELHRERWDEDARREAEKREEEASAEAWRPAR